jgi:P27 family predicted phage terminase small subunit
VKGTKPSAIAIDRDAVDQVRPPPSWLSRAAKAEWRRVMPLLVRRRILTVADLGGVENYCVAIGRARELERQIQAEGVIDPRLFRMQMAAIQSGRQLAAELGLTPVSRSRPAIRESEMNDDPSILDI